MARKKTNEQFVKEVLEKHNNFYSYEGAIYTGALNKILVNCPIHGYFEVRASKHLEGHGCKACQFDNLRLTTEIFIEKANEKHNHLFTYDNTVYTTSSKKVAINCASHGEFLQIPNNHLRGAGCPKCYLDKSGLNLDEFTQRAQKVHGDKIDYSNIEYKKRGNKITFYCKSHGEFKQTANCHLNGHGCPKCGNESHWKRSDYIKKAKERICTFYILRCFNEEEEFYKIGITMNSVKKRYPCTESLPYNYEIVSEIMGEAGSIWDMELVEKRKLKCFNYQPQIKFKGSKTECFTKYKLDETE